MISFRFSSNELEGLVYGNAGKESCYVIDQIWPGGTSSLASLRALVLRAQHRVKSITHKGGENICYVTGGIIAYTPTAGHNTAKGCIWPCEF